VGSWWVNVTVEDGFSGTDSHNFTLTVFNVNDWPVWKDVPDNAAMGITDTFHFDVNATDVDVGDVLSYSISSTQISTISIDTASGIIDWIPGDTGVFMFNLSATDTHETIYWDFSINVTSQNSAPSVTLTEPADEAELEVVDPAFKWAVTDIDGDDVTCDIYVSTTLTNVEGLSVGSRLGEGLTELTFTPTANLEKGQTYYWTVIPDDGADTGECASGIWSFSIKEDAVVQDKPPTFTSLPPSNAEMDEEFTYEPVATDPDGDEVIFALVSGPVGMVLEGGELKWTPASSDLDASFTVNVSATANGKTVYQEFDLKVISIGVTPPVDDDDDDTTTGLSAFWIVIPLLILIVLVIIVVAVIIFMRKKKAAEEETEPEVQEEGALDAEVESDAIFKQAEGGAYAAPAAQPATPLEQYPAMETQQEPAMGMETQETPMMDSPVPDQLPAWGEGTVSEGEVSMPEGGAPVEESPAIEDTPPDMDSPYEAELDIPESGGIKQLDPAEDGGDGLSN